MPEMAMTAYSNGTDTVYGGNGADDLHGNGYDILYGDVGDDYLYSQPLGTRGLRR
jgi:hypothetical protein